MDNNQEAPHKDAIIAEGSNLAEAIAAGARALSLDPSEVDHKIDISHFRNDLGRNVGVDTVKIWAWPKDMASLEASRAARSWLQELLGHMGFEAEVLTRTSGDDVILKVRTEEARHLVGRQGATINAVRYLLVNIIGERYRNVSFRVDVDDNRSMGRQDEGPARGGDDERREGGGRRERGGRRDREDRGDGEDGRRERRGRASGPELRGRGQDGRERPIKAPDLEKLVLRLAEKVESSGEPELLRKELNPYARRFVHLTIQEQHPGLATESLGDDLFKQVRIFKAGAGEDQGSSSEE